MAYSNIASAIGASGNGTSAFFPGTVEDVRVYDYALTPKQVSVMAAKGPR